MIKRPCLHPGCRELVTSGRCERHAVIVAKEYEQRRGTSTARGYGARWRRERAVYLRHNPLCIECKRAGAIVAATDVDHIVPHQGDDRLMWDQSNWQSLCHKHHAAKTAREDGGFGNAPRSTHQIV